jgi:hypothetical protein
MIGAQASACFNVHCDMTPGILKTLFFSTLKRRERRAPLL